jgi:hypothetical protein
MIKHRIDTFTGFQVNNSFEGETIEEKIERVLNNNEPITDGAPIIYTDRRDGVLPAYDIRTDRFEIAIDAMNKVSASQLAKRADYFATIDGEESDKGNGGLELSSDNTSDMT